MDRNTDRKKISGRQIAMGVFAACLVLAACVFAMIPKDVEDIVGPEDGTEVYIGDDYALEYSIQPEWFKDEPVRFESEDEEVFTVDGAGVIHGASLGEALMRMTAKDYTEEITVRVIPKVTSISGISSKIKMNLGDSIQLQPVLEPEEWSQEPVTYAVEDGSIAAVSENGTITALSKGKTTLTVSAGGCEFETAITVREPEKEDKTKASDSDAQ